MTARPVHWLGILTIGGAALVASANSAAADSAGFARVRSSHPYIRAMITEAGERSATFRDLIESIDATNGIVYVEHGMCGHSVHACLSQLMTPAGAYRILWVKVDARQRDWEVMGSIAHELQHAIEVLTNTTSASNEAVFNFYARAAGTSGTVFETPVAIRAGDAVLHDVSVYARRK